MKTSNPGLTGPGKPNPGLTGLGKPFPGPVSLGLIIFSWTSQSGLIIFSAKIIPSLKFYYIFSIMRAIRY